LFKFRSACFTKPMQHEPSRLLCDADLFRQLHARYALAGRHKQIHRVNPLMQGNMAALKYCASANGKVFLALVATIVTASAYRDALAKTADRATRAIRPQK